MMSRVVAENNVNAQVEDRFQRVDLSGRPFHFIGVGGIGMSALAYILLHRQIPVSGSDVRSNRITDQLEALGSQIFLSQTAENLSVIREVGGTGQTVLPQVICSTAIKSSNPEYQAAITLNCPIFHRSDVLAALISEAAQSISVAGTHGKTTTSSLIGHLLVGAGLDPTIVIGGEVGTWQGNARVGASSYLVAEADESDGSLVKFRSQLGVITNIELDHPDHYSSLDEVMAIFQQFIDHTTIPVVNLDCPNIRDRLLPANPNRTFVTYSLEKQTGADYTVSDIVYTADGSTATVWEQGEALGSVTVPLLGAHNLSNALAAIAIARQVSVPFATLVEHMSTFGGAKRRFEVRGEVRQIRCIDDYAHHPSEVQATLASARLQVASPQSPWKRVIAAFQPHRYSRTHTFLAEFSQSFTDADQVIITDIYSAGEPNQVGIEGAQVAEAIAQHHPQVQYQATLPDVVTALLNLAEPGDLILFLGAGNINSVIPEVLEGLESEAAVASL
jgi:UDP-N-acetylmuramate--alanine ligase